MIIERRYIGRMMGQRLEKARRSQSFGVGIKFFSFLIKRRNVSIQPTEYKDIKRSQKTFISRLYLVFSLSKR